MNTNFIIHEPAGEYHARSRKGEFMSSHLLADFRESPALYNKEVKGEIEQKDTPAFVLGRAAHSLILEGRTAFDRDFVVTDGPVNPRTGEPYGAKTKAYADWLASQEREVVSGKDYDFILKLQRSVHLHAAASELLASGEAEGVVRAEYCGVPCQIRMDWFSPESGLVDLKTCDSLKWFEADCRRYGGGYGYIFLLAFYRAVIGVVTGVKFLITSSRSRRTSPSPPACGNSPATSLTRPSGSTRPRWNVTRSASTPASGPPVTRKSA